MNMLNSASGVGQSLTATADSVVHAAGATTQYGEAIALQNWLSTGSFKYSLHAPTVLSAVMRIRSIRRCES